MTLNLFLKCCFTMSVVLVLLLKMTHYDVWLTIHYRYSVSTIFRLDFGANGVVLFVLLSHYAMDLSSLVSGPGWHNECGSWIT